jgi:hypothetical protein
MTPVLAIRFPPDSLTALLQVSGSFNHVFVPPWAVPAGPQQQGARTHSEAGVQTSTSAGEGRPHTRQSHTVQDAAVHFQVGGWAGRWEIIGKKVPQQVDL